VGLFYILLILLTLFVVTTLTNQSYAQVTWKTFEENTGLYTIQIPSNWYPEKLVDADKVAPIDDIIRYTGKGDSFAYMEIAFSGSLYKDAKEATDAVITAIQNYDNFQLLTPTECDKYTINGIQACSNEVTFKLKDENQRTVLTVIATDQNGIQHDITFVASNDIYDRFIPVGEYMISSLKVDTNILLATLNMQSVNDAASPQQTVESTCTSGLWLKNGTCYIIDANPNDTAPIPNDAKNFVPGTNNGFNWLNFCKISIVDSFITEPCNTLTSPDGYTLTTEGQKVLGCIGGGTLAVLTGHSELVDLKSLVGCGDNSNFFGSSNNNIDLIGNIMSDLFK
jgi:hypothetical protein